MRQSWSAYEQAAERGPLNLAVKLIFAMTAIGVLIGGISYVFSWFGDAAEVVHSEAGPKALLSKYSWFKDAAAQLSKKHADISVYLQRVNALEDSYKGVPRQQWSREDREQYNIWLVEVAGTKASYNALAAEYNAQMTKINWRFANIGGLPPGEGAPLPRDFAIYATQ